MVDFPKFCVDVQIQAIVPNHPGLKLLIVIADPVHHFFLPVKSQLCVLSQIISLM